MEFIHPRCKYGVILAYLTVTLNIYFSFSSLEILKIFGRVSLSVIGYATVNDIINCHRCIEYWTLGHWNFGKELKHRLVRSLNPWLNAIIWGPFVSWFIAMPVSLFFALLCRANLFGEILDFSDIQEPLLCGLITLICISQLYSRYIEKRYGIWEAINQCNRMGYMGCAAGVIGGAFWIILRNV